MHIKQKQHNYPSDLPVYFCEDSCNCLKKSFTQNGLHYILQSCSSCTYYVLIVVITITKL